MRQITAGTIPVSQDIDVSNLPANPPSAVSQHTITLSPSTKDMRLIKIPGNTATQFGLQVFLPEEPSDEDEFSVLDADGSCSANNLVVVFPDPDGTATVSTTTGFPLLSKFQRTTFTFDAEANNWDVDVSGNIALFLNSTFITTDSNVSPGDLTGSTTTPAVLFAIEIDPTLSGAYDLAFALAFTLGAADTVTLSVQTATGVTAFSGGNSISGGSTLSARYETPGSPVVVPSAAPTNKSEWSAQIPASALAQQTATWAGVLSVPAHLESAAIIVSIETTGGSSITNMSLGFSARQVFPE